MTTLILAFVVMTASVAAMAIGVMFGRRPITGSCGGMKALGLDVECEVCRGDPARCVPAGGREVGPRVHEPDPGPLPPRG